MSPSGSKLRASVSWESTPPSGCPASSDAAPAGRLGCRLQQRTLLDRASARLHSLTQSQADHLAREDMEAGPPTSTRVSSSLKPRRQSRHAARLHSACRRPRVRKTCLIAHATESDQLADLFPTATMARKFTSRGLTVCAGRGASPPGTASIAGFLAPARSLQLRSPSPADSGVSSEQRRSSTFPSASANGVLFFRLRQDHHE